MSGRCQGPNVNVSIPIEYSSPATLWGLGRKTETAVVSVNDERHFLEGQLQKDRPGKLRQAGNHPQLQHRARFQSRFTNAAHTSYQLLLLICKTREAMTFVLVLQRQKLGMSSFRRPAPGSTAPVGEATFFRVLQHGRSETVTGHGRPRRPGHQGNSRDSQCS